MDSPKKTRRLASSIMGQTVLIGGAVGFAITFVPILILVGIGTSDLGLFLAVIFFGPPLVFLAVLGASVFLMRAAKRRREDLSIRPLSDGLILGLGLALSALGPGLVLYGNQLASLRSLAIACAILSVPVGLFAIHEFLHRRWSGSSMRSVLYASVGFIIFIVGAAIPSLS